MTTGAMVEPGSIISTGSTEIDKKLGGGIPVGSLVLLEGQSDAGKSVVSQHFTHGSLNSRRRIIINPVESGRGGKITVTGSGFMATDGSATPCALVEIAYAGVKLTDVRPDSIGSFETTITVPPSGTFPSVNAVTATIYGCPAARAATATHKVPTRSINSGLPRSN